MALFNIENVIDQLSRPISCEICGSICESATTSFTQSQDSSKINCNTSNESWISESSCDCNSPRSPILLQSQLTFHNHNILPPLLCSSAKTEMQVYKRKAIERERRKKERKSNHLISEVDSILIKPVDKILAPKFSLAETVRVPSCEYPIISVDERIRNENFSISPLAFVDPDILKNTDIDSPCKPPNVDSGLDESSFQENAYRNSLQNLLHKSLNDSSLLQKSEEKNTSDVNDRGDAETAVAVTPALSKEMIEDKEVIDTDSSPEDTSIQEVESKPVTGNDDEALSIRINQTAENLVNSVIESVRRELAASAVSHQSNKDDQPNPLQNSSNESPLKSCSLQCPYFSPRSSKPSSPCKATEQINRALHLIENEFLQQFKPAAQSSENFSSPVPPLESESSLLSPDILKISDSSAPFSIQRTESNALNCSLDTSTESTDTETEVDVEELQLECLEAVNGSVSTSLSSPTTENAESRVRKGSFTIDTPSALLLSSRTEHTIYSDEASHNQSDVKRKLDMRSDSEESLLSTAITDISLKPICVPERASVPDYYQLMDEQHKKEMFELQRHHHEQLQKFKEKFLNCQVFSPQQLWISDAGRDSSVFEQQNDPELHRKWCKLSALVKGHLTRQLLGSQPVQTCMQTIRDTSRTILSMRSEDTSHSTNMAAIQDATLMNRLFSQLKAAMFQFHAYFFDTPIYEQMDMIHRSRDAEAKGTVLKVANHHQIPRLSAATMKSLQRKKDVRNSQNDRHRNYHKEVKSKISSIWKTTSHKKVSRGSPKGNKKSPSVMRHSYCEIDSPLAPSKHHRV